MNRTGRWMSGLGALVALLGAGCSGGGEYVVSDYDPGGDLVVSSAPPPAPYEVAQGCGYDRAWQPGAWDWRGSSWRWRRGRCVRVRSGYTYVQPYYSGGRYTRGYWAAPGQRYPRGGRFPDDRSPAPIPGYIPPPAPATPSYRPAPPPTYVPAPPPAMR